MTTVRILIVDDNNDFSALLSTFLSASGFDIVGIAADGLSAIKMIYETNPDVVLLDIIMPEVDGFEVLKQIRNTGKNSPLVLILSAMGVKELYQRAQSLGANGYYVKPIQMEVIVDIIRGAFDKSASIEENVTKIIHNMKIPQNILGSQYLRDLILIYLNDNAKDITSLSHIVANSYNVKYELFLSSIRYAIQVAWDQDNGKDKESIFYRHKSEHLTKPSIKQLVRLAALKS